MSERHDQFDPPPPHADEAGPTIDEEIGVGYDEHEELVPDLMARRFSSGSRSYWQIVWGDFARNRPAVVALWVMAVMAMIAVFASLLANHRPFVLYVPEELTIPFDAAVSHGWQFPLFAALSVTDWILLFGFLDLVVAFFVYRRARRSRLEAPRTGVLLLAALAFVPLCLALTLLLFMRHGGAALWFSFDEQHTEGTTGILIRIVFNLAALAGIVLVVRRTIDLLQQKRDALGNPLTGSALVGLLVGAFLVLLGASQMGTVGQRELDTTNYAELAESDGVFALFAPIQHDFLSADASVKNQGPFAPYVRVQPSGGSDAAIDLGLTDTRRPANIAFENTAAAGENNPIPITASTPLSDLNRGVGVAKHDERARDFTIVAQSLDRFSVSLYEAETVGDAIDRINQETGGVVTASLRAGGTGIALTDSADPAPRSYLGTDGAGSDVASRIIMATRVALSIGFVSTTIALTIGITMGALMGYFGGWVDIVGMRIIEIFMAIPRLFLLLTVIAFIPPEWNEYMLYAMMAVIGLFSWMTAARYIRAEFFRLRDQDFIQAAKAAGLPLRSVLFKHMLPNGVTPVLVDASFGVAAAIFIETGLSFLGFGIKPPNPSWGKMLSEAVDPATGVFHWWMAIFPGIMIFVTVFAFNLIGDALRDAIDPKLKKAAN